MAARTRFHAGVLGEGFHSYFDIDRQPGPPDHPRAEQIAIARRVLSGHGSGARPTYSRRASLTQANGKSPKNATPASNPGASTTKKASDATKKIAKKVAPKKYSAGAGDTTVRVKRGETHDKIAKRHHVKVAGRPCGS